MRIISLTLTLTLTLKVTLTTTVTVTQQEVRGTLDQTQICSLLGMFTLSLNLTLNRTLTLPLHTYLQKHFHVPRSGTEAAPAPHFTGEEVVGLCLCVRARACVCVCV